MSFVLEVEKLKKVYPSTPPFIAVDEISFALKSGEILGFLGPNGSGKTTTIQMLLGLLSSTSGQVRYFGKDFFKHRSEILKNVTFASTYTNLPWPLTVAENLIVFGSFYGLNKKESEKLFDPLLERFGILDKRNKRTAGLSAGQMTRLMLVKAFFPNPKVVLLDEPTASLDPHIAQDICDFLLEQREKRGTSILFCSHKMEEVMDVCDRCIFLQHGKIIADDTPLNLAKSVSKFVLRLVIVEGMEKMLSLLEKDKLRYEVDHRHVQITLEEEVIPAFLRRLNTQEITYTNIRIEEPSLDTFFLQIARKN